MLYIETSFLTEIIKHTKCRTMIAIADSNKKNVKNQKYQCKIKITK